MPNDFETLAQTILTLLDRNRLAGIGYAAYSNSSENKNFEGKPLLTFEQMQQQVPHVVRHWEAAAEAIRREVLDALHQTGSLVTLSARPGFLLSRTVLVFGKPYEVSYNPDEKIRDILARVWLDSNGVPAVTALYQPKAPEFLPQEFGFVIGGEISYWLKPDQTALEAKFSRLSDIRLERHSVPDEC